ncbi:hypothetical protein XELAEV_18007445mg [Xenopus laevis]|uniref:Uncharacterized protein n=1 Tax=Xenopus laevis TaxID=8355 RepID=A0A974E2B8_XENLA|nr:hypothetical protein XELAEV_18007445mg [Xenopus laevis]
MVKAADGQSLFPPQFSLREPYMYYFPKGPLNYNANVIHICKKVVSSRNCKIVSRHKIDFIQLYKLQCIPF